MTADVTRLREEPIVEREPAPKPTITEPVPAPRVAEPAPVEQEDVKAVHAAYATAARILSVRALLGLALIGGFILAVLAIWKGGYLPLIGLGGYLALTVIPIATLEWRRH